MNKCILKKDADWLKKSITRRDSKRNFKWPSIQGHDNTWFTAVALKASSDQDDQEGISYQCWSF